MNVLVTGCAGFIGSHFSEIALKNNFSIVGVDALTYAGNLKNIDNFKNEIIFYKENICNTNKIEKIIVNHEIEWIVNFAAETHVDNSIINCDSFIESNIVGVKSLLDICKKQKCKLLHISTDEVYGSIEKGSFLESDKLNPRNPYSASKASAEHLINAYNKTYNVHYNIVRMSNNFGPRQNSEKFLPTIIKSINENKKIPVYGNGLNVRDWLYVKDACNIILKILNGSNINQIFNISFCNEMTNIALIKKLGILLKKDLKNCIEFVEDRKGHDFRYSISNKKIIEIYSNLAQTDLNRALLETIKYYM
jgi:dTDP-glucose 4,6-dehydratase